MFTRSIHCMCFVVLLLFLNPLNMVAGVGLSAESLPPAPAFTEDAARQKALDAAPGSRIVRLETKHKRGRTLYAYLLIDDTNRTKVTVSGDTGEMVEFKKEPIESVEFSRHLREAAINREAGISISEAKEIALKRSGGGDVVKVEKDFKKDGRILYEIEIISGDIEHEIELDADTGAIMEYESKRFTSKDDRKKRHKPND